VVGIIFLGWVELLREDEKQIPPLFDFAQGRLFGDGG
jgi:hypothetical protein